MTLALLACLSSVVASQTAYEPGATLRLYYIGAPMDELLPLVPGQTPNVDVRISEIDFSDGQFPKSESMVFKDQFLVEIQGEIEAKQAGVYSFRLSSDDGSMLSIDRKTVISNDGVHPVQAVEGRASLTKGWHPFQIRFFENNGGERLLFEWMQPDGSQFTKVTADSMRVPAGITRVVSPGPKSLLRPGGPLRPGSGMPLSKMHPGWDLINIRPINFKPQIGGMAFLPNGDLLICTFHPNQGGVFSPKVRDGALYRLSGVTGNDRSKVKVTKLYSGLKDPLGLAVVGKDIYVSQQFEITKLVMNASGSITDVVTVAKGWTSDNYHHFTFGLLEKGGWLYGSLSTSITSGAPGINGPNPPNRGTVFRVDPKHYDPANPKANIEFLTGGHRTPNGLGWGPEGELFVGENQGAWQPANRLNNVRKGRFFGHYNNREFRTDAYPNGGNPGPFDDQPLAMPALFLPQNECANSPAQPVMMTSGEFNGQMLISDVKYGGVTRAFLEKVEGEWQGGAIHFLHGFESGTHRLIWGPDGALYVGGIGASQTWGWTDPVTGKETTFGLQKVKPNGKSIFEIHSVSATSDGFEVRFTRPVPTAQLQNVKKYYVKQWHYAPTPEYGGDKQGVEVLNVAKAVASSDRKSVRLVIPGLKEGRVVYLRTDPKSDKGDSLWSTEVWYTLNRIPGLTPKQVRVLVFSKTAAFRHDSIPDGIAALKKLGERDGWKVEATEDASIFTDDNMKRFDVVVFLSTTGDVLNDAQQKAFEGFIRSGGGYVGIHAAADTEYEWPWYGKLVGAYFKSHPAIQQATIHVEDRGDPSTIFLPENWVRKDEWYNYRTNPRNDVHVLATLDESTYQNGAMGKDHPIMWKHEFDGGRAFYFGGGHTKESYQEPKFLEVIAKAVRWASQGHRKK